MVQFNSLADAEQPKVFDSLSYPTSTYVIGHYNPSVRIIDPDPHTTYVVCVNFYTWVAGPTV